MDESNNINDFPIKKYINWAKTYYDFHKQSSVLTVKLQK